MDKDTVIGGPGCECCRKAHERDQQEIVDELIAAATGKFAMKPAAERTDAYRENVVNMGRSHASRVDWRHAGKGIRFARNGVEGLAAKLYGEFRRAMAGLPDWSQLPDHCKEEWRQKAAFQLNEALYYLEVGPDE